VSTSIDICVRRPLDDTPRERYPSRSARSNQKLCYTRHAIVTSTRHSAAGICQDINPRSRGAQTMARARKFARRASVSIVRRQFRGAFQIVGRSMIATRATERETAPRFATSLINKAPSSLGDFSPTALLPLLLFSFASPRFALRPRYLDLSRRATRGYVQGPRSRLLIAPVAGSLKRLRCCQLGA